VFGTEDPPSLLSRISDLANRANIFLFSEPFPTVKDAFGPFLFPVPQEPGPVPTRTPLFCSPPERLADPCAGFFFPSVWTQLSFHPQSKGSPLMRASCPSHVDGCIPVIFFPPHLLCTRVLIYLFSWIFSSYVQFRFFTFRATPCSLLFFSLRTPPSGPNL